MEWLEKKTSMNQFSFRVDYAYYTALVLFAIYHLVFFIGEGYLQAPFFFDKYDTFMDFFNIQYWAFDEGRYSDWQSIYTPFSFVLAKFLSYIFFSEIEYEQIGFVTSSEIREFTIDRVILIFGLVVGLIFLTDWFRLKGINKVNLYFIYLSVPLLFTLERGNLIIFAYLFLLLFFLTEKNVFWSSLFLALAISLKFYLIALLFIPLLMLRFGFVVISLAFFFVVNEISAIIIGSDDWFLFLANMVSFTSDPKYFEWAYYSYSYRNLVYGFIANSDGYTILEYFDYLSLLVCFVLYGLASLKFILLTEQEKYKYSGHMYLLLLMLIMIVVNNAGGYVFVLLFPFILFMTQTVLQKLLLFILVLPMSVELQVLDNYILVESFWSSQLEVISRDFNLGMIIRPMGFFLLYLVVSYHFLTLDPIQSTTRQNAVGER